MRCTGSAVRRSSRSRLSARWAPRLLPATACTSSTITKRMVRSVSRAREVRRRKSDSGVVMRMSGGLRSMAARSFAGVSPVRTPTREARADSRQRAAEVALDVVVQRLERADVEHLNALAGPRAVERPEEGRERLPRARRRLDERVLAGRDRGPAALLGRRRRVEGLLEPAADGGAERRERAHRSSVSRGRRPTGAGLGHALGARPSSHPDPKSEIVAPLGRNASENKEICVESVRR